MIGKTISHYKILEKLGEGGMGIVYKAEDSKLKRPVALKFLPSSALQGKAEKNRFIREAQAAAALNQANIAHIYAIEEFHEQMFIAMEFIKGQSLAEIIGEHGGSPLPLEKAIDYAKQIAAGLQAAHEKSVVHRDIKSANIMVTEKGVVKIMDFGLAKLSDRSRMTMEGSTVGTAAYMSPEQAQGHSVDHRTDIWSLGVVLYEMISGQLPFNGEYEQAVVYAILNEDPQPLTALRSGLPIALDGIIAKALAKETKVRYQHVDELPADLEGMDKISTSRTSISLQSKTQKNASELKYVRNLWIVICTLLTGFVLVCLLWWFNVPDKDLRKWKFKIEGIVESDVGYMLRNAAISPNGEMIAFIQSDSLWIQDLKELEAQKIIGAKGVLRIFWSPNSDYIAYLDSEDKKFKKVNIQTGSIKVICNYDYGHHGLGEVWKKDGTIIVGVPDKGFFSVSDLGGELKVFTKLDTAKDEAEFYSLTYLPNGTLLGVQTYLNSNTYQLIKIKSNKKFYVDGMPDRGMFNLTYSRSGHLIYNDNQGLWAVPFSASQAEITGEPFPIDPNGLGATVSNTGTLVYTRDASLGDRLILVDRIGSVIDTLGQIQSRILNPAVSPGGYRIAVSGKEKGNWNIWIHDIKTANKQCVTFSPFIEGYPLWHPTERSLIFWSQRFSDGALFEKPIDGSGESHQIQTGTYWSYEPTISSAADYLVYTCWTGAKREAQSEIWYVPIKESGPPVAFLSVPSKRILAPELSPDGKYLAYQSNESGQYEVYVTTFPGNEDKKKVSLKGGYWPKWNATGSELYYCSNNNMIAVKFDTDSGLVIKTKKLFNGADLGTDLLPGEDDSYAAYDVMPDGQHFVVVQPVGKRQSEIIVVQNWFKEFEDTK